MRTLVFCLLATAAYGEERSWTITYTTQAELVEVRGDTAFLKTNGTVNGVPLNRLSESDRQYVASLPLAPISHGGAGQRVVEEMPPGSGGDPGAVEPASFTVPQNGPALMAPAPTQSGERSVLVTSPNGVVRQENYEGTVLPAPAVLRNQNGSVQAIPQNMDNLGRQPPLTAKQLKAQQKAERKRAEADSRRGLFGSRNRRLLGDRD
jgi:hypothetical protein